MTDISALLASYPRAHPPLPPGNARIYVEEYKINRGVSDRCLYRVTASLESWMHHQVAACGAGPVMLDVGAGTLNHRHYEEQAGTYDIVEPLPRLHEGNPELARIDHIYPTIQDVPPTPRYDRIFSIAVLEHVENLPAIVAASAVRLARRRRVPGWHPRRRRLDLGSRLARNHGHFLPPTYRPALRSRNAPRAY
jgi:hypothetical protein